MILADNITKRFENHTALDKVTMKIERGCIYGLVGTNGSGKSTMLRLISGVYYPNEGAVSIDGQPVFENPDSKQRVFFVSDDLFFPPQATLDGMAEFYRAAYPNWSNERYQKLCELFPIGQKKKIATFSKGMRRQAALILALASSPEYLLLDEAFDGLDPVIRHAVRRIISDMISEYNITVVISSHNLRELEDFCDKVGLLHNGVLRLECDMDKIQLGFCKLQAAFRPMPEKLEVEGIRVLSKEIRGSVATLVCAAGSDEAIAAVSKLSPLFCEAVGLTLEEVFIYEMEALGYDYSKIIF
ncbi:MAG: ABC transporter ATP-binding protein [Oscillospiraceae bacterium]|nr:ABC transporter ATP-binding protein [Oscillospiraceae bacterium]MBP1578177.1 ABC transporter ATP-binding protein [Oscillospiraceae bacterium]